MGRPHHSVILVNRLTLQPKKPSPDFVSSQKDASWSMLSAINELTSDTGQMRATDWSWQASLSWLTDINLILDPGCLRKFKPRSFDAKLTTGVCLALKQITQSRKKRPACGMLRLLSVHTSGLVLEGYPRVECAPPQLAKRAVRHTKEENSGQVTCLKKV
ncbi:Hypothetical protein PP7435_CHR3-0716 [Komagataella phaffii CBS 7435]|uniref:Uncharacterized protein n=1 Tax=Komagataella phaffii (strain ATCC 76273 / CBS 7435 / CECT 11047 / NRRL Y-11430 / Wegner 21-1) TaxID=981350 RepID=F2QW94_KOMPC|nr:Hypothetical protein BQ9382_C3-3784 [Komagataella phaffii CBS 7435]CCA39672.1 Hypothetical protein PP7435_CHR3-0716 [Komagataella phaffii CBS 7435]